MKEVEGRRKTGVVHVLWELAQWMVNAAVGFERKRDGWRQWRERKNETVIEDKKSNF